MVDCRIRQARRLSRVTLFAALALAACADPPQSPQFSRGGLEAREELIPEEGAAPSFDFEHTYTKMFIVQPTATLFFSTSTNGFALYASATSRVWVWIDYKSGGQLTYSCSGLTGCGGIKSIPVNGCPTLLVQLNATTDHYAFGFGEVKTRTTASGECGYTPQWPDPPEEETPTSPGVTYEPTDGPRSGSGSMTFDECVNSGGLVYEAWWDYDHDGEGDEYIGDVCMYSGNMT